MDRSVAIQGDSVTGRHLDLNEARQGLDLGGPRGDVAVKRAIIVRVSGAIRALPVQGPPVIKNALRDSCSIKLSRRSVKAKSFAHKRRRAGRDCLESACEDPAQLPSDISCTPAAAAPGLHQTLRGAAKRKAPRRCRRCTCRGESAATVREHCGGYQRTGYARAFQWRLFLYI